jgi:hypothetical protein
MLCTDGQVEGGLIQLGINAHRECLLRSVLGGIGHLIAHDYWCTQRNDPDAGLTYRQSALLTAAWTEIVSIDQVEIVHQGEQ